MSVGRKQSSWIFLYPWLKNLFGLPIDESRAEVRGQFQVFGSLHQPDVFAPQPIPLHGARCEEVNIDESQTAAVQMMTLDEKERLIIRDRRGVRKIGKQGQNLPPIPQVSASQFTDNKRMHHNLGIVQQTRQPCLVGAKVVDPHGCVDQDHSGSAAARRRFGFSFRAAQSSQTCGTHLGDKSFETKMHKRRLLLDARESRGFGENLFIQNQCRSHSYEYGFFICCRQGLHLRPDRQS